MNFIADCVLSLLSVLVLVIVPRSAWRVAQGYFARPQMSRRKLEQHKEHDTLEQIHVEAVGLIEALCEGLPQLVLQTAVYCLDYSQAKARVPYFLFSIGVSAGTFKHCVHTIDKVFKYDRRVHYDYSVRC
jgi:cell division protein FtsB